MQISKVYNLDLNVEKGDFQVFSVYRIKVEVTEMASSDRFNWIKNPLSLFLEGNNLQDVDKYLENLFRNFKRVFSVKTLNLPLREQHFKYELDNELFDQYYKQVQNLSDNSAPANLKLFRLALGFFFRLNF